MTKDEYFSMCEQLGSEPVDSEIPFDIDDFPELVQTCFLIYSKLPDIWDYMAGNYCGKNYSILFELFRIFRIDDIEEEVLCLEFLQAIDIVRSSMISAKVKQNKDKKPAKKL